MPVSAFTCWEVRFADRTTLLPIERVKTVELLTQWNTGLHRSNSLASQQCWPQPGRLGLPDVGEAIAARVLQPDSWRRQTEVMPGWRVGTFQPDDWWSSQAVAFTSSILLKFLVICMQLDVRLLVQNLVKMRHCLPALWKCIHWFIFSIHTADMVVLTCLRSPY